MHRVLKFLLKNILFTVVHNTHRNINRDSFVYLFTYVENVLLLGYIDFPLFSGLWVKKKLSNPTIL